MNDAETSTWFAVITYLPNYINRERPKVIQRYDDLTGKNFGMLTVVALTSPSPSVATWWFCRSDCGNITYKTKDTLTNPD